MLPVIAEIIKDKEFISVATCDFKGRPNAAPKLVLKLDGIHLFLVDYTIGRTWENIRLNPRVSLSFVALDDLTCYQVNGSVESLQDGPEYAGLLEELTAKQVLLSTKRIIEGVTRGKGHSKFEVSIRRDVVFFKVKVEEIVAMGHQGEIKRQSL